MQSGDALIVDAGQPCYVCSTNGNFKSGQRYWAQAAQGDMGYAIPALVGIYKTNHDLNPIACIGEGSFMTNVQELATIAHHKIPAKIIVINNDGYMSIKQTQQKFFHNHQFGVSQSTGVNFPSIANIAQAFGIEHELVSNNADLDRIMASTLHYKSAIIIEVQSQTELDVLPAQAIKPDGTQGSLHDMAPFLTPEELKAELLI
jgi:acetolactate synthase-1/2/3 large subunit